MAHVSTNFYMYDRTLHEIRHLGQRAGGWQFQFRAYPEIGIRDMQSWLRQLDNAEWIRDEYSREYDPDDFLEAVEACEDGQPRGLYGMNYWRDADGHVFSQAEFS